MNYNSTDCAIKSIESIYKTINRMLLNIIVVDNASNDNPERILQKFPKIRLLINKKNIGFSKAVNAALAFCKAPYLVLLNPDTIVLEGFFESVIGYLEKNKHVGIIGPKIYEQDGTVQGSARRFPTLLTSMFGRKSPLTKMFPNNPITSKEFICFNCNGTDDIDTDWVSGACMVTRRKVFEEVSGFDERFFLYWEDADLCKRTKQAGWKVVYYPKAEIIHSVGKSSSTCPICSIYHFHNSCYKLFVKHTRMPFRLMAPLVLCGLMLRCLFVIFLNEYQSQVAARRRVTSSSDSPNKICASKNNRKSQVNDTFFPAVLIVNQYFPPDRSATAGILEKITSFLANKYRVTVLAGRPSYQPDEFQIWQPLSLETKKNLCIIRVGSTAYSRSIMAMRVLNYCSFLFLAWPVALLAKAQLIMALTDPPLAFLIAEAAAKLRKLPFVYYIQDLHPDMAVAAGMIHPNFLTKVWERVHRWGLKNSDKVFVLGEDMRRRVLEKGVDLKKTIVIRHGSQELTANLLNPNPLVVKELKCGFNMAIIHAGNLGHYGAWDTIIESAHRLKNGTAGFVFIGEGVVKDDLLRQSKGCDKIRFLPFRPRSEFECVLAAGDIHLITIRHGLEGAVVPSKLYPIIAAGRPVLALAPAGSDVAKIVQEYGCGVVVDPGDPEALVKAIEGLAKSPQRLVGMGQRAKVAAARISQTGEIQKLMTAISQHLPLTD